MAKSRKPRKLATVLVIVLILATIVSAGAWYAWDRHRHDTAYMECLQSLAPFEGTDAGTRFDADFLSREAMNTMESEAYAVVGKQEASALDMAVNDVPSLSSADVVQCLPSMSFAQLHDAVTTNTRISDSWAKYAESVRQALDDANYSIATHEYSFPELFNLVMLGSMYPFAGDYCRHDGSCITIARSGEVTIDNMTGDDPFPEGVASDDVIGTLHPYYQSLIATPDQPTPIHLCAATADFSCMGPYLSNFYPEGSIAVQVDYVANGVNLAEESKREWTWSKYDETNMPDSATPFLVFNSTYKVVDGEVIQTHFYQTDSVSDDDVYYRVTPTRNEES